MGRIDDLYEEHDFKQPEGIMEQFNHSNLHPDVVRNIQNSEIMGGAKIADLKIGKTLCVQTQNTLYRIKREEGGLTIQGHFRFCPVPTECFLSGSTWGGSMIKVGYIGRGMYMEFRTPDLPPGYHITTSMIKDVWEE